MSWNIFSRSFFVDAPCNPSSVSSISARTAMLAPASARVRSRRLSFPSPPCATTSSAVLAATKSASLAIDVPPGLTARNRISSSLNVVGLSTTRTPFDRRHSVMPIAVRADVAATVPGVGSGSRSGRVLAVSTYGASVAVLAARIASASAGSPGRRSAAVCGPVTITDSVAIGRPGPRNPVDFLERDLRQEALRHRMLVDDARDRLIVEEVADELLGERLRWVLVALDHGAVEVVDSCRASAGRAPSG